MRSRRALLASLVVVAAVLVWWQLRGTSTRSSRPTSVAAARPAPEVVAPRPAPAAIGAAIPATVIPVTVTPATDLSDPASRAAAVARLDETVALYRRTMTHPLWSRPADGSNAHLTAWNQPIAVGQELAVDADQRAIEAIARLDRVFAAPGAPVVVEVVARYLDDGAPAAIDELVARLQWRDRAAEAWVTVQPVALVRGGAGWTGQVVPSAVPALRDVLREARVAVYVRIGEYTRELTLDFAYAVEPPVVVHGLVDDRIVDGDLALGLEVDVAAAAPVALQATLYAADGTTAIAVYDDRYVPTRAGRQIVPVRVHGKILHDRGLDGPYRLGAIHGYVYRQDQVPDAAWFDRADLPAITTRAHRAADFSSAPFQSPEIDAQLARYAALRDSLGDPPPPAP